MKELEELQAYLESLIGDTVLKDRHTEVEIKIYDGKPQYRVSVFQEASNYSEEFKAMDSTVDRCKRRTAFEVTMLLEKNL